MKRPFFSIIMATHNRVDRLPRALDSVFRQEDGDYELIVVDDGSTDGTREWIAANCADKVQYVYQENQGPGPARNTGIKKASGEYVCFLDSDDQWFSWTLSTFRAALNAANRPSFLVASPRHVGSPEEADDCVREPLHQEEFPCYFASVERFYMVGCPIMVISREILQQVGCFAPKRMNGEDSDLCLRLGTAKGYVRIHRPETVIYVRHENSETFRGIANLITGVNHMLEEEAQGRYPGEKIWRRVRWLLLTTHSRSASVGCLRTGRILDGVRLYGQTFRMNVALGNAKYLAALPSYALLCYLRKMLLRFRT